MGWFIDSADINSQKKLESGCYLLPNAAAPQLISIKIPLANVALKMSPARSSAKYLFSALLQFNEIMNPDDEEEEDHKDE